MIRRIAKLHDEGMGYRETGRELEAEGMDCQGGVWFHTTIKASLGRAGLIGEEIVGRGPKPVARLQSRQNAGFGGRLFSFEGAEGRRSDLGGAASERLVAPIGETGSATAKP